MDIIEAKMLFVSDVDSLVIRGRGDLPLDKLKQLKDNAKKELINILLDKLKKNDWRAVVVMGELKVKEAKQSLIKILKDEFNSSDEQLLTNTAYSIWQITNEEKYVDYIMSLKRKTKLNTTKIEAISLLSEIWTTKTINCIIEDIDDSDEMIRIAAVINLIERHNVGLDKATINYWTDTMLSNNLNVVKKTKKAIIDFFDKNNLTNTP